MTTQLSDYFSKNWRSLTWQAAIFVLWIVGVALEHLGYRIAGIIVTAIGLGVLVGCATRDHHFSIENLQTDALEAKLFMERHKQLVANLEVGVSNLAHKVEVEHPMLKEDIDDLAKWVRPKVGQLNDLIGAAAQQLEELKAAKEAPGALPAEDTVQEQNDSQAIPQPPQKAPDVPTHFQLPQEVVQGPQPSASPGSAKPLPSAESSTTGSHSPRT